MAYELCISDWSSDVCSSDLGLERLFTSVGRFSSCYDNSRSPFCTVVSRLECELRRRGCDRFRIDFSTRQEVRDGLTKPGIAQEQVVARILDDKLLVFLQCIQNLTVPFRISRSEEHTTALQSLMRTSYAVFCL